MSFCLELTLKQIINILVNVGLRRIIIIATLHRNSGVIKREIGITVNKQIIAISILFIEKVISNIQPAAT